MIRMTVAKWLAAGALALSVPAIGLAGGAQNVAGAAMASVDTVKSLSTGSTSTPKTKHHHKKKLSHARSHKKNLHSRHHKAKKLKATTPAAS